MRKNNIRIKQIFSRTRKKTAAKGLSRFRSAFLKCAFGKISNNRKCGTRPARKTVMGNLAKSGGGKAPSGRQ
ncbi:MAG: hypothetical protein DBX55_02140 [Verrucomicrobia bacterium]|nr:MAG: hypothetical protein DBX55_02140 [Verrucomicrobiota bacterium]